MESIQRRSDFKKNMGLWPAAMIPGGSVMV